MKRCKACGNHYNHTALQLDGLRSEVICKECFRMLQAAWHRLFD